MFTQMNFNIPRGSSPLSHQASKQSHVVALVLVMLNLGVHISDVFFMYGEVEKVRCNSVPVPAKSLIFDLFPLRTACHHSGMVKLDLQMVLFATATLVKL